MALTDLPLLATALLVAAAAGCASPGTAGPGAAEAGRVLDELHAAAAAADGARYFDLFAPDAVFLGTDATERWTIGEFRAWAEPFFSKGTGWTYRPRDRQVFLSADGGVAWFDERLDHDRYGELRGTGVLRLLDGRWRVAQYNLAFPVPNGKVPAFLELIRNP